MTGPLVLLLHRDPVTQEIIAGSLGDEFEIVAAHTTEQMLRIAERRPPAVAVIEIDVIDRATQLYAQLQARGDVRAIFLVDGNEPRDAWTLTGLGTVLPKTTDIERLRNAIRKVVRLQAMSAGVERLRTDTGRLPEADSSRPRARGRTDPLGTVPRPRDRTDPMAAAPVIVERRPTERPAAPRTVPPPGTTPPRRK
jgi:DNA-binding response OmpR family regulator